MRISVLGPVTLLAETGPVDLGPPRHRALFAALLVDAGHVVAAEVLLERVWGVGPLTAHGTLHSAVSHLRRHLRPHPELTLDTQAPGYLLRSRGTSVDAAEFAALLVRARTQAGSGDPGAARASLDEALGLWRGQPYADVDADFARAEADRLTALRLAAVELAAELDLVLGRHVELAATLPTVVADHPLREGLRASLVLALYRSGRQGDALRAYAESREILAEELGVDPGPALQRLHARVLAQDPALDLPAATSVGAVRPRAVPRATPPAERPADGLVGRVEEKARLAALLVPSPPQVRAAVLVGEAGVGKTALVEAVVAGLPELVEVEWGRCWDHDSTAALWPWSQALGALARNRGPAETSVLVSESGPEVEGLLGLTADQDPAAAGDLSRARLFTAVAAFLGAAARRRPLVLVLEDLHWADQDSADLLGFVLETVRDVPLRIVATVRSPADTATDRGPGLLAELARRSAVVRLDLRGLDVGEVAELAETQLGRPVRPEQAVALHERTNGNPFFISELVRLRQQETEAHGRAGAVPDNVRTVVERRLTHLPAGTVEILGVGAVLGRDFSLSLLARVLDRRAVDLAAGVDAAVAYGILAPVEDLEHLRFAHALVQETLLAGLGPMRRAGLHAAAAATLEELSGDRRERAALIASHWAAAGLMGDVDRAVSATLLAADVDQAASASVEAERHLRRALDLARLAPGATAEVLELEVRTRLATLLTLVRGYNDDSVALERRRSFELAERLGSAPHLLPALWGRWGIALVSGDFDQAYAHADALQEAGRRSGNAMLGAAARLARGQTHWHRGRLGSARHELEQAVEEFAAHADQVHLEVFLQHPEPTAAVWLALVLAQLGEQEESDRAAARAAAHPAVSQHSFTSIYRWVLIGFRSAVRDEPEQALRSEAGLADAVRLGFDQLAVFSLIPVGWAHGSSSGQLERGLTELHTARGALLSVAQRPAFVTIIWWLVADLHHRDGDDAAALAALDEADRAGSGTGEDAVLVERLLLEARVLRRLGRPDDAAERDGRLLHARRQRLV